jgi:AcrR family transcriptional regulator
MTSKPRQKREKLHKKLVELAEKRIAKSGLANLRARDLAEDAGCALGSIYNLFADMNALILEVGGRTLQALDTQMALASGTTKNPAAQLQALGQSYLKYARAHPLLWRALFDHHLPENSELPIWFVELLMSLMAKIAAPLSVMQPQLSPGTLALRARTMFAAVHGVVSISLDNRFIGLSPDSLESELERFIQLLLDGAEKR